MSARHRVARAEGRRCLFAFCGGALALAIILAVALSRTPDPLVMARWSTVILDRNGELLGAAISEDGQWRFPPSGGVNPRYASALIEFEDRRFRSHPGVDPLAIARALGQWFSRGKVISGASTITMQTVRLLRSGARAGLPSRVGARGLFDKGLEALLALRLEASFSKDRIMRIYASVAPYGGNVVGLEAASWRWFGRGTAGLTWAEAATLAVLPNNPALVNPGSRRAELRRKRDVLLRRLSASGRINADDLGLAMAEELPDEPFPLPRLAPQLLDRARSASHQAADKDATHHSLVRTSVDRGLQAQVSSILDRQVERFAGNGIRNAACVVLDIVTGEALAYVGNASARVAAGSAPFVDLADAPRSSGSLLKPFLYAAMLEAGELLPDTLVLDVPTRIGGYLPENNVRGFQGALPAKEALARSLNIPAVRELRAFGVDRFAALLRDLGITTLFRQASDYGLPLILGGGEITLWEITGLYAGLARTALSTRGPARAFSPSRWTLAAGASEGSAGRANPYSGASAWLTLDALLEVARPGEDAAWQQYASGRRIAWKTGTSFGFRDAWAVGVNPRFAVGVWVGNASGEGRPDLRGILNAAPILFEVFSSLPEAGWFAEPYGELVPVTICASSGYLAGPFCPETTEILVPKAGAGSEPCPYCRPVTLELSGKFQATVPETPSWRTKTENRFVLPPTVEWFYRKQHYEYRSLPPFKKGASIVEAKRSFSIITPTEGAILYAPVELSGALGQLVFEAAATDPNKLLYWHIDDEYVGLTSGQHRLECRPAPGKHRLTLVDEGGAMETVSFTVLSK